MGFLLGFLPWILYWALVGNVDFRFAVCIALAVVIGTQLISRIGESWPSLKASSLLIFVLLAALKNVLLGPLITMVFRPVTEGIDIITPPGKIITKIVSLTVKFGEPLDFSRYEGMSEDRFILRSITDEIMYAIMDFGRVRRHLRTRSEGGGGREAKAREADEVSPQA